MKKLLIITGLILFVFCSCAKKNINSVVDNLDRINTANIDNPKSYEGGNIVDDRAGELAKIDRLKIKDYATPNIKIKLFLED